MNDSFCKCFVQHFAVPLLESFRLGNLLIRRVTVEDVVIAFTRWAGPYMTSHISVGGKIKFISALNMKKTKTKKRMNGLFRVDLLF